MTVDEIITLADAIKKNDIGEELKLRWINDVEGRVHCEIKRLPLGDFKELVSTEQELSVPEPYSKMYLSYILSMIAFVKGDYGLYSDVYMQYERDFTEYAKFCLRGR